MSFGDMIAALFADPILSAETSSAYTTETAAASVGVNTPA